MKRRLILIAALFIVSLFILDGYDFKRAVGQEKATGLQESEEKLSGRVVTVMANGTSFTGKLENKTIRVKAPIKELDLSLNEISYIYMGIAKLMDGRVSGEVIEKEIKILTDEGKIVSIYPKDLLFLVEEFRSSMEGKPLKIGDVDIIYYETDKEKGREEKSMSPTTETNYTTEASIIDEYSAGKIFMISNPVQINDKDLVIDVDITKQQQFTDEFMICGVLKARRSKDRGLMKVTVYNHDIKNNMFNKGETKRVRIKFYSSNLEGKGYLKMYIVLPREYDNKQIKYYNTISNVLGMAINLDFDEKSSSN